MPKVSKAKVKTADPTLLREVQKVLFKIVIEQMEESNKSDPINVLDIVREYQRISKSKISASDLTAAVRSRITSLTNPKLSTLQQLKNWYADIWPLEDGVDEYKYSWEETEQPSRDIFVMHSAAYGMKRRKFLSINYNENDSTRAIKDAAENLVRLHGGVYIHPEDVGSASNRDVFVICFGSYNREVTDFMDKYQHDLYHPSLIFSAVKDKDFSHDDKRHVYADRSKYITHMKKGLELYIGTQPLVDGVRITVNLPAVETLRPTTKTNWTQTKDKRTVEASVQNDEISMEVGHRLVQTENGGQKSSQMSDDVSSKGLVLETSLGGDSFKILYTGLDPFVTSKLTLSAILPPDIKRTFAILKISAVFVGNNNAWNSLVPIQNYVYENDPDLPHWYKEIRLFTQDIKRFIATNAFLQLSDQYPQVTPAFTAHLREKLAPEPPKQ